MKNEGIGIMQTKWLQRFLWLYMFVMAFVSVYIYGFVMKADGDNVEHLHTSWMIWMGYVPYKDFFQHHNPLTWYLSSPLVAYLINDRNIFSIFNSISVLGLYAIAYYNAKIFLLYENNKTAALFLGAVLISAYSLLWSCDYRPDTFMFIFFFMGLYYLLLYIRDEKCSKLVISFLCFFISFMFTQKVLMHVVIPGLAVFYWLYKKKMKFTDLIKASIIPLILLGGFLGYMYHHGALYTYWLSNFEFNTHIPEVFEENRIILPPREYLDFYFFVPIAGIAAIYFLFKGNGVEKMFSWMFWLEIAIRTFYFSAFLHYVIFLLMVSIMLTVMLLSKPLKYKKVIIWADIIFVLVVVAYELKMSYTDPKAALVLGTLVIIIFATQNVKKDTILATVGIMYLLFMSFYSYQITYKRSIATHQLIHGHEYALDALTPCDYALNGYFSTYNLKAKDAGYYATLLGQIDVLGEKVGVAPRDDFDKIIREKLPKIISGGYYWDTYLEQRGQKVLSHKISEDLINQYYEPTGAGNMLILKPQYRHHGCVYNGKEWKYMD